MPSTRVNVLRPDSRHHRLDGSLASDLLTCGTSMLTREEQTDDHRCICLRRVSPSSFTTPHTPRSAFPSTSPTGSRLTNPSRAHTCTYWSRARFCPILITPVISLRWSTCAADGRCSSSRKARWPTAMCILPSSPGAARPRTASTVLRNRVSQRRVSAASSTSRRRRAPLEWPTGAAHARQCAHLASAPCGARCDAARVNARHPRRKVRTR